MATPISHELTFQALRNQVLYFAHEWPYPKSNIEKRVTHLLYPSYQAGHITQETYVRWHKQLYRCAVWTQVLFKRVVREMETHVTYAKDYGDQAYAALYGTLEKDVSSILKKTLRHVVEEDSHVVYTPWYQTLLALATAQKKEQDASLEQLEDLMIRTLLVGGTVQFHKGTLVLTTATQKQETFYLLSEARMQELLRLAQEESDAIKKTFSTALPLDVSLTFQPVAYSCDLLPYDALA